MWECYELHSSSGWQRVCAVFMTVASRASRAYLEALDMGPAVHAVSSFIEAQYGHSGDC